MKPWLKAALVLFLAADLALTAFLAVKWREEYRANHIARDALAQWVGDTEALSEDERRELYARKTGEALAMTYVQGECKARDGRVYLRFSNQEEAECAVSLKLQVLDSGKTLARTDLLNPGYRVESMETLFALPPGQYECLAILDYYWMKNDAFVGTAARQVLVTAE